MNGKTPEPGAPAEREPSAAQASGKPGRKVDPALRKQAILEAALTVFAERGYEAARLDDVAARAGVAKGTLYLYFKDKEALFEELLQGAVSPVLEGLSALASAPELSFGKALAGLYTMFERDILGTQRKLLLRLIIAEGPRFPHIAEMHYRNVISRVLPLIEKIAERAAARGEIASDAVARYPQLIAAPLLVAVLWDAMFAKFKPLDVGGMLNTYRELLTSKPGRTEP
jgi:AcrR family transcriptional regulator